MLTATKTHNPSFSPSLAVSSTKHTTTPFLAESSTITHHHSFPRSRSDTKYTTPPLLSVSLLLLSQYLILDGFQRQIDEEQYTLRKLRSIIGHQTDDIERLRRKIAGYTEEAEDRKALQGMEKLKVLKA